MSDSAFDNGPSIDGLRAAAFLLGALAVGCLVRLLTYAGDGSSLQPELFVWALLGAMSAVFSAACCVLVGIKSVERRLARTVDSVR